MAVERVSRRRSSPRARRRARRWPALAGAAVVALSLLGSPARGNELIVASGMGPAVCTYAAPADGNVSPRLLAGPSTALSAPVGVAFDGAHDEIVVANAASQTVTAYPRAAGGDAAPLRVLGGAGSGLVGPVSAAVDPFDDELVVVNGFGQSIATYARGANGGQPPRRLIAGASTDLAGPYGLALDLVHGEIVVSNITSRSVTVHARLADGAAPPLRAIAGASTGLAGPRGVAVDPVHDEIFVANVAGPSVTVYARTAQGDVAPLRRLEGPSTGLVLPVGIAVDVARDEIVVTGGGAVWAFARTAEGDTPPLRTITGSATALVAPTAVAVATSAPLVAAVLPSSRSVRTGQAATAFATIINAGTGPAAGCGLALVSPLDAGFFFQTTEPVGNTPIGAPNVPVNIPAGGSQSYVFAVTPRSAVAPTDVRIGFACAGTERAAVTPGLDTLLLVASDTPVPDVIAQSATVGNTGIVGLAGPARAGAFSVATSNVGAPGRITATADTGGIALPVDLFVCRTEPASGNCMGDPVASVSLDVPAGATPTFAVFAFERGPIPFDPATNRVFVRFTESGVTRGATSVAVRSE